MKCPACKHEWKEPSRVKGGKNSRRKMSTKEAKRVASLGWQGAKGDARRAKLKTDKPKTKKP